MHKIPESWCNLNFNYFYRHIILLVLKHGVLITALNMTAYFSYLSCSVKYSKVIYLPVLLSNLIFVLSVSFRVLYLWNNDFIFSLILIIAVTLNMIANNFYCFCNWIFRKLLQLFSIERFLSTVYCSSHIKSLIVTYISFHSIFSFVLWYS